MIIGVHNSINSGILTAIEECKVLKTNASQIFLHSPRIWQFKKISKDEIRLFKKNKTESGIVFFAIHSSYLISPLSDNKNTLEKSINLIEKELAASKELEADCYVIHIRENKKLSLDENIKNLEKFFKSVKVNYNKTLLENSANGIGSSIKNLVYISKRIEKISGICLDTAHLFESGYDIRKKSGVEKILEEVNDLKLLKMIHMNDSKTDLSSKLDRHEHISKGKIGEEGFKNFFSNKHFRQLPIILETPKKSLDDDLKNLLVAKKILLD